MDRVGIETVTSDKQCTESKLLQLQTLVQSLETSNRGQAEKITRLTMTLHSEEDNQKALEKQILGLRQELAEANKETRAAREALRALDAQRDELQNALDEEVISNQESEKMIAAGQKATQQLRALVFQKEENLQEGVKDITTLKSQISAMESHMTALKQENAAMKRDRMAQRAEVSAAAEDLMLMTRENQALTSELASNGHEMERSQNRLSELSHANSMLEQAKRALEIERADLLESYRAVLRSKGKLEADLSAMGDVKERVGMDIQAIHSTNAELKGQLNALLDAEAKWASDRVSLGRQVEALNGQLISNQRHLDSVEADNRRVLQDAHGLRQTNLMLNERIQMIIKRATAAGDANKLLSSRLTSVERERDAMRALVNSERQRATELEHLTQAARLQTAMRDKQISRIHQKDILPRGDTESIPATESKEETPDSEADSSLEEQLGI